MVANRRASVSDAAGRWSAFDRLLDRLSDRLNPILIKEARQSLKSRQFLVTFSLVLVFAWSWSLLGISMLMPAVYYSSGGPPMFIGYSIILTIPLLVVIPFAAFRSLASEREDRTFELLTITDLSARQIVIGKLGSAVLQMLIYASALAPCIAFTYLLRGMDIVSIVVALGYTLLLSPLFAALGLLCATLARTRTLNVVMSVGLVLALTVLVIFWMIWIANLSFNARGFLWIRLPATNAAILSFYVAALVMVVLAAAGQISFEADNRSTPLRVVMVVHNMLWVGWMTYLWLAIQNNDALLEMLVFAVVYWAVMGALMIGEKETVSPRVLRTLPVSFVGRIARTWFNPGSGTGYVFCVLNYVAVVVAVEIIGLFSNLAAWGGIWLLHTAALLTVGYLAFYLGIARLAVLALRARKVEISWLSSFLLTGILAGAGAFVPYFVQAWASRGGKGMVYTVFQAPNWVWTLQESDVVLSGKDFIAALVIVVGAGTVLFLVNLYLAYREVERTRLATPVRVLQDEQTRHPRKGPEEREPGDPWSAT